MFAQAAGTGARGRPSPTSARRAQTRRVVRVGSTGAERQGSNRVMAPGRSRSPPSLECCRCRRRGGAGRAGAGSGARPAGDDRRSVLSLDRLPRTLRRLGRRPDDRARQRARRPAACRRRAASTSTCTASLATPAAGPIDGAEVEIWQCDAFGSYRHPRGGGDRIDAGFQGFGAARSDAPRRLSLPHDPAGAVLRADAAHPRQAAPSGVRRSHVAAVRRRRAGQRARLPLSQPRRRRSPRTSRCACSAPPAATP